MRMQVQSVSQTNVNEIWNAGSAPLLEIIPEFDPFKPREYWTIEADFLADGKKFTARLVSLDGKKLDKFDLANRASAEAAARRGVDVRLMLPGKSDSELALAVGHSDYGQLLKAGVKIFEYSGGILHSKCAVIDGVWSTVGSSNFDHRSVLFNDEVDAVILGRNTARQFKAQFERDESDARQITLAAWHDRSIMERLREFYSRMVENLL